MSVERRERVLSPFERIVKGSRFPSPGPPVFVGTAAFSGLTSMLYSGRGSKTCPTGLGVPSPSTARREE
jgi:hypothetical protein